MRRLVENVVHQGRPDSLAPVLGQEGDIDDMTLLQKLDSTQRRRDSRDVEYPLIF